MTLRTAWYRPEDPMPRWKITLAYDGTLYRGWQVQPGLPTVQGALAEALRHITGEATLPQGSGRTDAGVHALGQVASVDLAAPIPSANLHRALNRCLPASIRILAAEPAPPEFHARHSAIRKTYEYRIFVSKSEAASAPDRICPPMLAPYVWDCGWPLGPGPLTLDRMNAAAGHVLGSHDFTSFAAADPDLSSRGALLDHPPPPIRAIHHSKWRLRDDLLVYTATGSGFLHHMVRNLVGTFVQVGANRLDADAIPSILAARDRGAAGPTAPAQGLFLVSVAYPPDHLTAEARPPEAVSSLDGTAE